MFQPKISRRRELNFLTEQPDMNRIGMSSWINCVEGAHGLHTLSLIKPEFMAIGHILGANEK